MKFIMQLPNGSFHVPSAALKISGLEGGDRIEIHTLERAAVIMKQQMNAMELLTTAEALNKLIRSHLLWRGTPTTCVMCRRTFWNC